MRTYLEPSARNLLRKPLVMGVPATGLILLAFVVLSLELLLSGIRFGNLLAVGISLIGYVILRVLARFAKLGWEEEILFGVEKFLPRKPAAFKVALLDSDVAVTAPDALSQLELISAKDSLIEKLYGLKPGEKWLVISDLTPGGAIIREVQSTGVPASLRKANIATVSGGLVSDGDKVYSLHQLPVQTDPLWLFSTLSRLHTDAKVIVRIEGLDLFSIKRRIELSRKSNARDVSRLSNVDSDVTFAEAGQVLEGLSRGDETLVEFTLLLVSKEKLDLDPNYFCEEKKPLLPILSGLGIRKRFHRSHVVRAVTASDLIPNINDPREEGVAILQTLRKRPLYFSPQDSRLEALHWLVVGASGSGKSFFTGLVLRRMIAEGTPMSVLFIDHNRSFRRMVRSTGGHYLETDCPRTLQNQIHPLMHSLNKVGAISGVELSDFGITEKKEITHFLLSNVEQFLRTRDTTHPVYLVLDECWNFMRDEPVLVQRAFREFRKLNGAVIAITQSLSDFLADESGQSICQNAPIRILLRQGEDPGRYQGVLSLNDVELARLRLLKQKKGVFSECLVKTPFLSRVGRLYPTDAEHELLRTDNLRVELIAEAKQKQSTSEEARSECAVQ